MTVRTIGVRQWTHFALEFWTWGARTGSITIFASITNICIYTTSLTKLIHTINTNIILDSIPIVTKCTNFIRYRRTPFTLIIMTSNTSIILIQSISDNIFALNTNLIIVKTICTSCIWTFLTTFLRQFQTILRTT